MRQLFFISILILFSTLCSCKDDKSGDNFSLVKQADSMPSFVVSSTAGMLFNSGSTLGKRVFIYFFMSSCSDCHTTTPNVIELWKQIEDQTDIVFLCIARGGGNSSLQAAQEYWSGVAASTSTDAARMPILYYDEQRKVFSLFATQNVPRFYVVDAKGKITWESEGNFTAQTLISRLNDAK